jgi:hypothetical protein
MLYGLLQLLVYSVIEFRRLSTAFPLWTVAAIALAVLLGTAFVFAGRSVYRNWRPPLWLGSLALLALPVSTLAFLLVFSAPYLRPAVAALIASWQQTFLDDAAWNAETFRLQYQAVSALRHSDGTPLENFADHPPPNAGGVFIPVTTPEAKTVVADIDSRRVAEHFRSHFPFLAQLLWTKDRPLPDALRQDMERFFAENPKEHYHQSRATQLASKEMTRLLSDKIGRIVIAVRVVIGAIIAAFWLPLFALAIYGAWKKLEPSKGRP